MSQHEQEKPLNLWVRMFGRRDMSGEVMRVVNVPEDALTPREQRIEQTARIIRWGAWIHGLILVLFLVGLLVGGGVQSAMTVLLFRFTGTVDILLAVVALLVTTNISLQLMTMVGIQAREVWALVMVWVMLAANVVLLVIYGYTVGLIAAVFWLWAGIVAVQDVAAYRTNPVMLKELRGRMRGMRAFVVMTVYLSLMSLFLAFIYVGYLANNSDFSSAAAGTVGRSLFQGVVGIQMALIIFIAPAFTAGAITGERERQTYDLLRTTLLASPSFVVGKLESALGYVLLLLLAAIPLQSMAFLFGGVSQAEVLVAFVILTVLALAMGTLGLFFSAIAPRTLAASVRTYTTALVAAFGVPLVLNIILRVIGSAVRFQSVTAEAVLAYLQQFVTSLNPVTAANASQQLLIERQEIAFTTLTLTGGGTFIPMVSPWITFSIVYLVVSAVMLVLTVREMRKVPV